jgi:hypothetical protein
MCLDLARARLRTALADRDGDGRIDLGDVALGDTIRASGAARTAGDEAVLRVERATVSG